MSKIAFKRGIQQHLDSIELTHEQLDDLMEIQKALSNNETKPPRSNRLQIPFTKTVGIAATLVIAVAVGLFYSSQQASIGEKIAYEVSKNHLNRKPLEVSSSQLNDLSKYFTQLDFKLVHTNILSNPNWELLGARYCSIQGNTAAQLRLKNKQTGVIETLYQAPYYANQFSSVPILEKNQPALEEYAKGMGIKIWVEKGVLFALTNNSLEN